MPRRALGPEYQNMTCIACGHPDLNGFIDKKGTPYIRCSFCNWMNLGIDISIVQVFKFLGAVLDQEPGFRACWEQIRHMPAGSTVQSAGQVMRAPDGVPAEVPQERVPVSREETS